MSGRCTCVIRSRSCALPTVRAPLKKALFFFKQKTAYEVVIQKPAIPVYPLRSAGNVADPRHHHGYGGRCQQCSVQIIAAERHFMARKVCQRRQGCLQPGIMKNPPLHKPPEVSSPNNIGTYGAHQTKAQACFRIGLKHAKAAHNHHIQAVPGMLKNMLLPAPNQFFQELYALAGDLRRSHTFFETLCRVEFCKPGKLRPRVVRGGNGCKPPATNRRTNQRTFLLNPGQPITKYGFVQTAEPKCFRPPSRPGYNVHIVRCQWFFLQPLQGSTACPDSQCRGASMDGGHGGVPVRVQRESQSVQTR